MFRRFLREAWAWTKVVLFLSALGGGMLLLWWLDRMRFNVW